MSNYKTVRAKYPQISEEAFKVLWEKYSKDPKEFNYGSARSKYVEYQGRFMMGKLKFLALHNELVREGKTPKLVI